MRPARQFARPHRHAGSWCIALVVATVMCGCSPAPIPSGEASAGPSPAASPSTNGDGPGLNPTESRVTIALSALGIASERAEGSVTGAVLSSTFDDGSELFVSAIPERVDHAEFSVLGQRLIDGHTVQRVAYTSGSMRDRFRCDDLVVEAEGDVPPGFADMDAFLAGFIIALGCSP